MQAPSPAVRYSRTLTALAVGALLGTGIAAAAPEPAHAAVGHVVNAGSDRAVRDSYLVVLDEGARLDVAGKYGVRVRQRYDSALNGMLVHASAEQARRLAADPSVRLVEQNTTVPRAKRHRTLSQSGPTCGLDRIDQRTLPLDGSYTYPSEAGSGVDVYLVDSGVDYDNPDYAPRAKPGFDAFGGDGGDELGNGTYMAGIIGGTTYGVAKKANLISVKVLDATGGGTIAGVVAGVDWITEHASGPSVANFVIGIPPDDALDAAVRASIASGVTYVLEAGADADDVDNASPARVREGITVGSADCQDTVAPFSNHGKGLDLYAPGVGITSDWPGGGTFTDSGTTVSAAHVSGAAAIYLSRHPKATPDEVAGALDDAAVDGVLTGVPTDGTPNQLLQIAR